MNARQSYAWPQAVNNWGLEEERAAIECITSGRLTMGSEVREFEAAFAKHVGARHAVMCNSGSSANLLAVAALYHAPRSKYIGSMSWRHVQGAEVIVPALAWSTTYAPLHQYGLRLRVVDIDPQTLNIDIEQMRDALRPETVGVVGVNLLGNPADVLAIRSFANEHGLFFLEDNCESMGATVGGAAGGRHCGTFGDLGSYSFFFSHHLNTVEGGMLVTGDDDLADLARCLRAHGWARDAAPGSYLHSGLDVFAAPYDFVVPGYNLRPSEIAAAVGLVQLGRQRQAAACRRENARLFAEVIADSGLATQRLEAGAVPFSLPLLAGSRALRDETIARLAAAGIDSRMVAGGCFSRHQAQRWYNWAPEGALPNANQVHDCGLMIGNHGRDLAHRMPVLRQALFG